MILSPTSVQEKSPCAALASLNSAPRELTELQRTARSSRSSVREVFRARIVLLAAEGQENRAIAEQLDTRPDTVSKWRRRFAERRMEGLIRPTGTRTKTSLGARSHRTYRG